MYNKIITYVFLVITPLFGFSQNEHNHAIQYTQNKITTKSYIDLLDQKEINTCRSKEYHYYNKGKIHSTFGGYTGYLLEGRTETTLENGQLLKSGRFKHGLKVGTWEEWNTNGNLSSIVRWKHGKKQGRFQQFNDNGKLIATGKYKKNEYHGKIRQIQNGKTTVLKYRKGLLKEDKDKKEKKKKEGKKKDKSKKKRTKDKAKKEKSKKDKSNKDKKKKKPKKKKN